jgi:hypothetical protein
MSFGNRLVVVHVGPPNHVFRSTLQGLNQSIVGSSKLFEITYPTGRDIPKDGTLWIFMLR